ncbi:hypothetical protein [Parabacteroides sp.]
MKKALLVSVLMLTLCVAVNAKGIELEPRAGASYSRVGGLHLGVLVSFRISDMFYFQPGALINTVSGTYNKTGDWNFGMDVPLYASLRIPVNNAVKVRLNAGPFVGLSSPVSFGTALETGVEYHNYYVGVSWLQNIINENCARLHFSIGYKFAL